jgi:hydrophobic/amphiphilic exporter-1 (mainly G- bacteria), HAE1 family
MSEFFIRRPIVAMVISILMIIMGLITLTGIPISKYPEITPPMMIIRMEITIATIGLRIKNSLIVCLKG